MINLDSITFLKYVDFIFCGFKSVKPYQDEKKCINKEDYQSILSR